MNLRKKQDFIQKKIKNVYKPKVEANEAKNTDVEYAKACVQQNSLAVPEIMKDGEN
jgi:hypothetical protein